MAKLIRRGFISLILVVIMCTSLFVGCGSKYEFNHDYLFGLCDPSGSLGGGVDKAITNEWLGDVADVLGVKSFRLWVNIDSSTGNGMFFVDSDNNLSFNKGYLAKVHDYVDNLKRGGVENFLFLNTTYLSPYESSMTGFDVPDVNENPDEYLEFIKLNAKAYGMLAEEFPEIKNWETGNEPDLGGAGMHKHGYVYGANSAINKPFIFSDREIAEIICDLSWYIRKELKAVNEENRVSLPGLSLYYDVDHSFFESIYEVIESKTAPFGQEFSDTDPDNYFDIIDYHPYMNADKFSPPYYLKFPEEMWDEWTNTQLEIHEIASDHGDKDKPAYFSEFGYTDVGERFNGNLQNNIADNYVIAFDIIKEKMPWVEVVFCFRATTLVYQKASDNKTEENYGIFYNQDDPDHGGKAKPAAKKLAEYFGTYDANKFAAFENKYKKK